MNRQLFQYHPQIGYTFIPGLKTRVPHESGGYLVKVNESGFRSGREFEAPKRPGTFRVLLFGDSFTAADGVGNSARYSDLLESHLPNLEIFNFGLSGTGTDQQYLIFAQMAAGIEHDLVIISVLVENIRRVAARYRVYQTDEGERVVFAKPFFTLEPDGRLVRHHDPVPKDRIPESELSADQTAHVDRGGSQYLLRQAINKFGSRAKTLVQRLSRWQPLPAYDSPHDPDWLLTKAILIKWIGECSRPVVVCPIPVYHYIEELADPKPYQARFRELGEETGAHIHDPLPDFWKTPRAERRAFRFENDIHPTPLGHKILAESLTPLIKSYMDQKGI